MKDFIKTVLAVITAMLIMSVISIVMFTGMAASLGTSSKVNIAPGSMLMIDMSTLSIMEQAVEDPMSMLMSSDVTITPIGLLDAVKAVNSAATDPAISFICLKSDGANTGLAALEEFRQALVKFRESGKAVIAYTENPSNGSYYLASAADKIFMTSAHGGMNTFVGISSQLVFLKDLLDKLGVNVQLIRHGKYKSAGEMFIRNSISAENRHQYEVLVNSLWNNIAGEISEARNISTDELNKLLDELRLNSPEDFLEAGLVDELIDLQTLKDKLAAYCGKSCFADVNSVKLEDYILAKTSIPSPFRESIAIIYADGEIVDGSEKTQVAGDRFAKIISEVRANSNVKAVVLRVNSPGGSVLASEKIKNELDRLAEEKPVVASFGDYAASGGYWISNNCEKIYSDKCTLTGSIGVFSMIPDFSKTISKLTNVNIVNINSNKHGDMYGLKRALTQEELDYMQESVEDIYEKFVKIVSEGREMNEDEVDAIAQGRVWAGTDATGIGLVDEIGTLYDALEYAAEIADSELGSDLAQYEILSYPKPLTTIEQILSTLTGEESIFSGTAFENIEEAFRDFNNAANGKVYARIPYHISIQ